MLQVRSLSELLMTREQERRRCELINKKYYSCGLTKDETQELEMLQDMADKVLSEELKPLIEYVRSVYRNATGNEDLP